MNGMPESSPAFSPFTLTDGTGSWSMTKDLVGLEPNFGCFAFATDTDKAYIGPGGCGVTIGSHASGGFALRFFGGLPTSTGRLFSPHSPLSGFDGIFGFIVSINGGEPSEPARPTGSLRDSLFWPKNCHVES
jgi:hypothetical protein